MVESGLLQLTLVLFDELMWKLSKWLYKFEKQ